MTATVHNQGAGSRFAIHRRSPRYPFIASVQASDPISERELSAQTSTLSTGGCYVVTPVPFDTRTIIRLVIERDGARFETWAVVAYSQPEQGMGVAFLSPPADQKNVIDAWMAELGSTPPT